MKLIERYIYDVTRRLPESMKSDVKMELEGQILDMLDGKTDEKSVKTVLETLGNPRVLARDYRGGERYLISPNYFDQYINVLKIVLIILAIVGFVGGAIDGAIESSDNRWYEMIGSILGGGISNMISGMLTGFAIVTIIFVILDYKKVDLEKDPWAVDHLPQLPKLPDAKISRTSMIFGLIFETTFSLIFVIMLIRYFNIFGWYENGELLALFFQKPTIELFIPFFIASIALTVIVHGLVIYKGYWSLKLAMIFSIYQALTLLLGVLFIMHPELINQAFILQFVEASEVDLDQINRIISITRSVVTSIIVITASIETASIWYKLYRSGGLKKEVLSS